MKEKKEHDDKAPTHDEKALALLERIAVAVEFLAERALEHAAKSGYVPPPSKEI